MRDKIIRAAVYYQGDYEKIAYAIKHDIQTPSTHTSIDAVTIMDDAYPKSLKQLRYPPFVLFYKGNLKLLSQPGISVVGSRYPDEYGVKMTRRIVSECPDFYVIISGLAKGIDATAHQEAIDRLRPTIAVIGCGIDRVYPKENEKLYDDVAAKGLIISEYPGDTPPRRHHFPFRNRLIAALGSKCVVTSATVKSGTMLTVNEAVSLGKEVLCLPYPIGVSCGEGCNLLISQGATILTNVEDFAMI